MYCPPHFAETRPEMLAGLIAAHPLGLLISNAGALTANAVPFQMTADGWLRAHLARANPQLSGLDGADVLVVFQGPQAYITPALYEAKAQTGKVVPTWNYLMVQVRGIAYLRDDADWLGDQIDALTRQMETALPEPWAVTDAPGSYITAMKRGIVGVEIAITDIKGKWKAGQNRSATDRANVKAALTETHPALAAATGDP
ncbi:MAG: FMN-binding negative transcriptional regulator [Paracoccus sp. (in: a-proteobacteria)]|uniref:FMN-binding negative transcriptional regulator n=1 Tax=Paracoccus sp. TaxID=267 RepID=UPI0026DF154F|nr:FMN-binding negative transcriptional regulator [Paracoccus sp. (in: a-proteobacteria)]MDO5630913.1 FMN-binding negative transcriptional regulator [Paracoccus sp. (in: a-proteobacteria)]